MATLTVIDEGTAPKRLTPGTNSSRRRQAEFEGYLKTLKNGQVGKLVPTGKESTRGLSARISRAGKRTGKNVERWTVDGIVYFKSA